MSSPPTLSSSCSTPDTTTDLLQEKDTNKSQQQQCKDFGDTTVNNLLLHTPPPAALRLKRRTRFTNNQSGTCLLTKSQSTTMMSSLSLKHCRRTFSAEDLPNNRPRQRDYSSSTNTTFDCKQASLSSSSDDLTPQDDGNSFENDNTTGSNHLHLPEEDKLKRELLKRKVVCNILFEAMRQTQSKLSILQNELQKKNEQVAARVILHHLLLNSWRLKNSELSSIVNQNKQLHKTIDNLCLQLRVVRHLQTMEKEKSIIRLKEYETLSIQLDQVKRDHLLKQNDLLSVSEERGLMLSKINSLAKENDLMIGKYNHLLEEKRNKLTAESKKNQLQINYQQTNSQLQHDIKTLRDQLSTMIKTSSSWQEKSRQYESKIYESKLLLENQDQIISSLQNQQNKLKNHNLILTASTTSTQAQLVKSQETLLKVRLEKDQLSTRLNECETQLEDINWNVNNLNNTLHTLKKENATLRNDLYNFSLTNVRRRRIWSSLYYIFYPIEIIRNLYK